MSALSEACARPFSNGTERDAWESKWCALCSHDHGISHGNDYGEPACLLNMAIDLDEWPSGWPEAWLPEPDDGRFFLPSRMVCLAFNPCELGDCNGDPGADDRAERIAEVSEFWKARR